MKPFTIETATVYRTGQRRYLTRDAALKHYARTKFFAKHPCECESAVPEDYYQGYGCHVHDRFNKVWPRYARLLRRLIRR